MGEPHGSVLGPGPFNIFINEGVIKFTDDTTLSGTGNTLEDRNNIQTILDTLEHCAENNRKKLNTEKCKVLRQGDITKHTVTSMVDTCLRNTTCENDLGIGADHKLNMSQECNVAAKEMLF